jgi:hypothetical protein
MPVTASANMVNIDGAVLRRRELIRPLRLILRCNRRGARFKSIEAGDPSSRMGLSGLNIRAGTVFAL